MSYPRYPVYKESGVPWLGPVPVHWDVLKLKYLASLRSGDDITSEDINESGEYPVYGGNGLRGFTGAYTHDGHYVLIGRQGALCGNVNYAEGKFWASEHAVVVTPLVSLSTTWLGELLRAMNLNQYSVSAAQPGLSVGMVSNLLIPIPPRNEQRAIAAFLERETAQIDALIAKLEQLVALLQEKRQALISHAVTKGLDPNAPMKPSGVEWLGEIPAHWEVSQSRRLFVPRLDLAWPEDIQLSATQAFGVIPQDEYELRTGKRVTKVFKNLEKRRHVEVDDFVLSMRSFEGGLERAWAQGCIRSSYVVLKPTGQVDTDFFTYLFKSHEYIGALQATANFLRDGQDLNFDNFSSVALACPSLDEQRAIAAFLDRETAQIDALIAKIALFVGEPRGVAGVLRERRAALITAAVTGQIDVRGVQ